MTATARDNPRNLPTERKLSKAYFQGRRAFQDGREIDVNPFPIGSGDSRVHWFTGWLDAKHEPLMKRLEKLVA